MSKSLAEEVAADLETLPIWEWTHDLDKNTYSHEDRKYSLTRLDKNVYITGLQELFSVEDTEFLYKLVVTQIRNRETEIKNQEIERKKMRIRRLWPDVDVFETFGVDPVTAVAQRQARSSNPFRNTYATVAAGGAPAQASGYIPRNFLFSSDL